MLTSHNISLFMYRGIIYNYHKLKFELSVNELVCLAD